MRVSGAAENGGYLQAIAELDEIQRTVTATMPLANFVLAERFSRVRVILATLDGLVRGYVAEESQRLDSERGEADVRDEVLRRDLDSFHERTGQDSFFADPPTFIDHG